MRKKDLVGSNLSQITGRNLPPPPHFLITNLPFLIYFSYCHVKIYQ